MNSTEELKKDLTLPQTVLGNLTINDFLNEPIQTINKSAPFQKVYFFIMIYFLIYILACRGAYRAEKRNDKFERIYWFIRRTTM